MAISLNSIKRVRAQRPPIICIYGGPGIGKTTFAAMAPDVVFIRCEDGLGSLEVDTFDQAATFMDVVQQLEALRDQEHAFKWAAIDSASALETLICEAVCRDNGKSSLSEFKWGDGYTLVFEYWRGLFNIIQQINAKGVGVFLIAHSEFVKYESPDAETYDRAQPKLNKKTLGLICESVDVIAYANQPVMVRSEGDEKKKRGLGIQTGQRMLNLVERPPFVAKNRYNLPEAIPLTWRDFSAALEHSLKGEVKNG